MNPHIKKLSVLFLIAAILTSSLALGVSAFINRAAMKDRALQQGSADDTSSGLASADGYKVYGAGPNGQNLTDEVTNVFARQLVEANPQGPQQNQDGSVQLFSPTSTELLSYLATNAPSIDILTPPVDDSRIQVVQNFDVSDISRYLSEVAQIQSSITSNPIWQAGLSITTADAPAATNWTSETGKIFAVAQDQMYATKVPAPLIPLYKSELAFFATMASFSNVVVQDPVAAIALLGNLDKIVTEENAATNEAIKDLWEKLPGMTSSLPSEHQSVLAAMLGIPVAQAQEVPVTDIKLTTTEKLNWAEKFWKDYKQIILSTALGTLKNFLMQKIGQKIIEWAEGAGVPGYVTNWLVDEARIALDAGMGLIKHETFKVCGNAATAGLYSNILNSAFKAAEIPGQVRPPPTGEAIGCPPASSGFYGIGGYDPKNFLDLMTHNTYNDVLNLRDQSILAAAAASQASVNEALSGRGSLDVKKCDDGSTPGAPASASSTAADPNFVGPPLPPNLRCADGTAARTVTPGSAKQELISKALSGAQDIIAGVNNEDMYAALVQVLTQAVVNYALREGEGIFENSGSSEVLPRPGSTIEQQLAWYSVQLDLALALTTGAITSSQQARATLELILGYAGCAEVHAAIILEYIEALINLLATLNTRAQEIQALLDAIDQLQQNPPVTQAQLDAVGSTAAVRALVTRARDDDRTATTVKNEATALYELPECAPGP